MSENPFTDGQQFSSARLNSMYNAHQNNGVLTGLDGSVGTNSFEVDVSAGEVFLNGSVVSTTATTVTHSTSDTEDRIDLITVDAAGAVSITTGSPAATSGQPVAPDIPTDEVLAVLVYVRGGSDEILSGDILNDYKVTLGDTPPALISPQGAGSGLDADTADNAATADALNGDNVNTVNGAVGDVTVTEPVLTSTGETLSLSLNTDTTSASKSRDANVYMNDADYSVTNDGGGGSLSWNIDVFGVNGTYSASGSLDSGTSTSGTITFNDYITSMSISFDNNSTNASDFSSSVSGNTQFVDIL